MIVVRITGGLGNQMFQYALARALQQSGRDVYLHWHPHRTKSQHMGLALNRCFVEPLSNNVPLLNDSLTTKGVAWVLRKFRRLSQRKNLGYEPGLLESENVYFDGYWQSEKYFHDIHDVIRKDFRFLEVTGSKNVDLLDFIESNRCVAVHVRQGDYVNHPELGGVCGSGYYQRALRQVKGQLPDARLLVFSDHVEAALSVVGDTSALGISWNGGNHAWMDMALMTRCTGHVIANSTFSWWGAWLARGSEMVSCPSPWFARDAAVKNDDICLPQWVAV